MVRSIDPGCEQIRGTHWPNTGRVVDWNSCRGNHLGQRPNKLHQKAGHMDASDPIRPQKTLAARGPSTYGSLLSQGRRESGVRESTSVVPAKRSASRDPYAAAPRSRRMVETFRTYERRWLWVPAFAGTTREWNLRLSCRPCRWRRS